MAEGVAECGEAGGFVVVRGVEASSEKREWDRYIWRATGVAKRKFESERNSD